jgi:alpha-1,2-mannosyltransferase
VVCCAVTGLLVSPFSWTHHWVWVVPLLIGLVTAAWRRRSRAWAVAAVVVTVGFSGFVPLPWPGKPPSPVLLLAGDLYVLLGLAVLVSTALVLARGSLVALPGRLDRAGSKRAGLPSRAWPSLIGWTMAWSPDVRLPSASPPHQTRRQR